MAALLKLICCELLSGSVLAILSLCEEGMFAPLSGVPDVIK